MQSVLFLEELNQKEETDDLHALAELVPNLVDRSSQKERGHEEEVSEKENVDIQRDRRRHNESMVPVRGSYIQNGKNGNDVLISDEEKLPANNPIIHIQSNVAIKGDNSRLKDEEEISNDSSVTALKDADVVSKDEKDENGVSKSNEHDISGFEEEETPKERSTKSG